MRILVAEDEKNLNRIITEALQDEGYSVDPCFNGLDALEFCAGADYDVIVLDINMPRMDGLSVVYNEWRFNLRKSNTEPVVRLNIETRGDKDLLKQKTREMLELIGGERA